MKCPQLQTISTTSYCTVIMHTVIKIFYKKLENQKKRWEAVENVNSGCLKDYFAIHVSYLCTWPVACWPSQMCIKEYDGKMCFESTLFYSTVKDVLIWYCEWMLKLILEKNTLPGIDSKSTPNCPCLCCLWLNMSKCGHAMFSTQ